jgi:hypothetical protein
VIPKTIEESPRDAVKAPAVPRAIPATASFIPPATTRRVTARGLAPSAIRIASSRLRARTVHATVEQSPTNACVAAIPKPWEVGWSQHAKYAYANVGRRRTKPPAASDSSTLAKRLLHQASRLAPSALRIAISRSRSLREREQTPRNFLVRAAIST